MTIRLILVGKTQSGFVADGFALYRERLGHYCKFSLTEIPELRQVSALSRDQIKEKEGELILKNIKGGDDVILLDERGESYTSVAWAQFLERRAAHSSRDLVFVIGGSYGFSESVYKRAGSMLSLSKMTFSHQLVRVIFLEQLYRAFTIIKGEPYHHE